MNEPRYTVGSVTGYRYMENGSTSVHQASGNRKPITTWYVYDRFSCYRPVAVFDNRYQRSGPYWRMVVHTLTAELQARSKARKLNRAERRWLKQRGLA